MTQSFIEIVDNVLKSTLKFESKHSLFTNALFEKLSENKDKVLLVDCDSGREWTAYQLMEAIITLSTQFLKLGISKGDVVACFCPNSDFHAITMISLWSIGAIYTGLHFKSELDNIMNKTNATYLIASFETIEVCDQYLMQNTLKLKKFFIMDKRGRKSDSIESLLESEVSESETKQFFECVKSLNENEICKIGFSSGTTGDPKAIPVTQRRVTAFGNVSPPEFGLVDSDDVCTLLQTLHHISGTMTLCLSLLKTAKVIIFSHFDCNDFIEKVKKYCITFALLVPSHINLLNRFDFKPLDSFCLKKVMVIGEYLPELMSKQFIAKFKPQYFGQAYESSEAGWSTSTPVYEGVSNIKSVGIPLPGYEIKIVSLTTGETLGANQKGEIYIKGSQTINNYLNGPLPYIPFDEEHFFRSGDLGYYDESGNVYCVERIKQIIKYCGHEVSPTQLQCILLNHEAVKEASVVGIADKICGEIAKAFVVLVDEFKGKIDEKALIEFVNNNCCEHNKLRSLRFIEELPKTALGKIHSTVLKQWDNV